MFPGHAATATIILVVGAVLTWVVILLVLVQVSRFLKKFEKGQDSLESNIAGMADQMRKLQITIAELLIEQKRITRLTLEGLDLKKAEMTGDFEIVEEPVPGSGTFVNPAPPDSSQPLSNPEKSTGPKFPELMK